MLFQILRLIKRGLAGFELHVNFQDVPLNPGDAGFK